MNAQELADQVASGIQLGRSQGLDVDVRVILPAGWTIQYEPHGYVLVGPWSDDWASDVWRIISFVSDPSFLSLRRIGTGDETEYVLHSCMEDGTGFRMVFRASAG